VLEDEGVTKSTRSGVKYGFCPVCGKRKIMAHPPFCSKHCAQVDLGRWLKGSYRICGNLAADEQD
jgi:endogenous inhibitor of DNA gyrase (YacG/DUF329 family)